MLRNYPIWPNIFVWLTISLAYIAMSVPLPDYFQVFRPDFLMLCIVFWGIMLPNQVGLFTAWFAGIIMDIHAGLLLGQYALSLIMVILICRFFYNRLRLFSVWRQLPYIAILAGIGKLFLFSTAWLYNNQTDISFYWISVLVNVAFWPVINAICLPWHKRCIRYLHKLT